MEHQPYSTRRCCSTLAALLWRRGPERCHTAGPYVSRFFLSALTALFDYTSHTVNVTTSVFTCSLCNFSDDMTSPRKKQPRCFCSTCKREPFPSSFSLRFLPISRNQHLHDHDVGLPPRHTQKTANRSRSRVHHTSNKMQNTDGDKGLFNLVT